MSGDVWQTLWRGLIVIAALILVQLIILYVYINLRKRYLRAEARRGEHE